MNPLTHFKTRLREAKVLLDPYPHFCLANIFPDEYYRALLRNLPASASYENLYEVTTLKLDHFRHRDQRDMNEGWTNALPPEQKEFWDSFDSWFLGSDLAQAVLHTCGDQMRARFGADHDSTVTDVQGLGARALDRGLGRRRVRRVVIDDQAIVDPHADAGANADADVALFGRRRGR